MGWSTHFHNRDVFQESSRLSRSDFIAYLFLNQLLWPEERKPLIGHTESDFPPLSCGWSQCHLQHLREETKGSLLKEGQRMHNPLNSAHGDVSLHLTLPQSTMVMAIRKLTRPLFTTQHHKSSFSFSHLLHHFPKKWSWIFFFFPEWQFIFGLLCISTYRTVRALSLKNSTFLSKGGDSSDPFSSFLGETQEKGERRKEGEKEGRKEKELLVMKRDLRDSFKCKIRTSIEY